MDNGPGSARADVVDRVDVVVVSYESASRLGPCLDSVIGQPGVAGVLVVDNGSTDRSQDVVAARPGVRWLSTGANLGFGRASNRAIAATSQPYVCILNPDLEVRTDAIRQLAAFLDSHPNVAIAAPMVVNPDGSPYPSARSFPNAVDGIGHAVVGLVSSNNPWTRRYQGTAGPSAGPSADPTMPDWVSGTAMLLRRSAVEAVGCFDERYFMYVEDVDLCWRLREAGWQIAQVPGAEVVHEQGVSSRRHPYRSVVDHHESVWRFLRRSTTGAGRIGLPAYAFGLFARLVLAVGKLAWTSRRARSLTKAD